MNPQDERVHSPVAQEPAQEQDRPGADSPFAAATLDQRSAEIQAAAVSQVTALGVTPSTVRATGQAAEQILAHLGDGDYDLLVLSARRQPVAQRLGSVARELAEGPPCRC